MILVFPYHTWNPTDTDILMKSGHCEENICAIVKTHTHTATVNSEIFASILFSRIALKDVFVV